MTIAMQENSERSRWAADANQCVSYESDGGVAMLVFNRPKVKNAFNGAVYVRLTHLLRLAAEDDSVIVVIITGKSGTFTSGADLQEIVSESSTKAVMTTPAIRRPVGEFMLTLVNYPKVVVAAVNGPAVGIGVTLLPHCDVVYAYGGIAKRDQGWRGGSKVPHRSSWQIGKRGEARDVRYSDASGESRQKLAPEVQGEGGGTTENTSPPPPPPPEAASFWTPFFRLAIVPEFCSSITFPEILGWSYANDMLYLGRKLTVEEALQTGLVSRIIRAETEKDFLHEVRRDVTESLISQAKSAESAVTFKRLMTRRRQPQLLTVLREELEELDRRLRAGHSREALEHLSRLTGGKGAFPRSKL